MDDIFDYNDPLEGLLDARAQHSCLARFIKSEIINSGDHLYLQCFFEPVSDEPDVVLKNEQRFWFFSNDTYPFFTITGTDFLELIGEKKGLTVSSEIQAEEQEKRILGQTKDKLIYFYPFYKYNPQRTFLYKNFNRMYSVQLLSSPNTNPRYFVLPVLDDFSYQQLKEGKMISVNSFDRSLYGSPLYLIYRNHLISAELQFSPSSAFNCQLKDKNKVIEYEFDEEALKKDGLIIYPDGHSTYAFLEKTALNLMRKIEKRPEITIDEKLSIQNDYNPDDDTETTSALKQFIEYTKAENLYYYQDDIFNFHACIQSGLLTILAGISGTGKTRLPLEYASFFNMTEEKQTLLFVTVSPSYTEPSDVLGFYDSSSKTYIPSDTGLVSFLKHAKDNPKKMHMVVFDEMNLSRIEYWFAPFMSILERNSQDRVLHLYDKSLPCSNAEDFPSSIKIADNVIFVGTINLDETTKELSDRLLDRSYVINLKKATFDRFNGSRTGVNKDTPKFENGKGELKKLFKSRDYSKLDYIGVFTPRQREFLDEFDHILNESDSQKGISFRTAKNIAIYLRNSCDGVSQGDTSAFSLSKAFDFAVHQTVMRKIKGPEEYISDLVGNDENYTKSKLFVLFEKYKDISDFEMCDQDIKNKAQELKRFAYAR